MPAADSPYLKFSKWCRRASFSKICVAELVIVRWNRRHQHDRVCGELLIFPELTIRYSHLAVPGDKGLRAHDNQSVSPIEPATQHHQRQASRIVCTPRLDLT